MPTTEDLNAAAQLIYGTNFSESWGYSHREKIATLAVQIRRNNILDAMQSNTNTIAMVMWG